MGQDLKASVRGDQSLDLLREKKKDYQKVITKT
jgi:hypothetical protein